MRFEGICKRILELRGYLVEDQNTAVDFVATRQGERTVAEAKLYRSAAVPISLLERAAQQLLLMKQEFGAKNALLLATIQASQAPRFLREAESGIELWDLDTLIKAASRNEELYSEFTALLREAGISFTGSGPVADNIPNMPVEIFLESLKPRGERIAMHLNSIKTGKPGSRKFEAWCKEAVAYLFGDQLGKLETQRRMEGGIYRADLISRIRPSHDFWTALSQDFRTRYVVFEFKNYSGKLSQDQIFLTEKYLYTNALRCFAIIITRGGAHRNAIRSAKGVLRNSGKLILLVTADEVLRMLRMKDRGDDPNDLLWDAVDDLLTDTAP
jgi:hypothetical protein